MYWFKGFRVWIELDFVLEIVFHFVLFFLFIIVISRLFKNFVLPFFYEKIAFIKKNQEELKNKLSLLDVSKGRIEKQIIEQRKQTEDLDKNVQKWQKAVADKNKNLDKENDALLEKIITKRNSQLRAFRVFKEKNDVIPKAIYKVRCEIIKIHETKKGRDLLWELVEKISFDLPKAK